MSILLGNTNVNYGLATGIAPQRKCFSAVGRSWAFFVMGALVYYRSSANGIIWTDAVSTTLVATNGLGFSLWYDGTYLHISNSVSSGGTKGLNYLRGIPNADGTISFEPIVQVDTSAMVYSSICINNGYVWIVYVASTGKVPCVIRSPNNGGWKTDVGFPFVLDSFVDSYWRAAIVPFGTGIYTVYNREFNPIKGRLWDGTWGDPETVSLISTGEDGCFSVVADDKVHITFHGMTDTRKIVYAKREGGVWSDEIVSDALVNTYPCITKDLTIFGGFVTEIRSFKKTTSWQMSVLEQTNIRGWSLSASYESEEILYCSDTPPYPAYFYSSDILQTIIKFNPTGTHLKDGYLKIRFDIYPKPTDKSYAVPSRLSHFVTVPADITVEQVKSLIADIFDGATWSAIDGELVKVVDPNVSIRQEALMKVSQTMRPKSGMAGKVGTVSIAQINSRLSGLEVKV